MFCTRKKNTILKTYNNSLTLSSVLFIHSEWNSEIATSQHANPSTSSHLQLHNCTDGHHDLWWYLSVWHVRIYQHFHIQRAACSMVVPLFSTVCTVKGHHIFYCKQDACIFSYKERSTCGSVLWPLKFAIQRFMLYNTLRTKTFL
jgi:hypothetical protein